MSNAGAIPFVMKDEYISVIVGGKPFALDNTHPTFKQLHKVLEREEWDKVPGLINLAQKIALDSKGSVVITRKGVAYKGKIITNTLSKKILEMVEHRKPVSGMLKFMENLYKNPSDESRNELYEWLDKGRFTLTDDGCFLAYKAVNSDYTDCHTGKINNSVGQVVIMARKAVDPDRRNECSYGLHFCSLGYLQHFGGQKIMIVQINPKDVVAIPRDYGYTKGRTARYEVLGEYTGQDTVEADIMKQVVVPVAKERQQLLADLLAIPAVKRAIRRGKIKKTTLVKQTYGRLVKTYTKFATAKLTDKAAPDLVAPDRAKVLDNNPLKQLREAAGISLGQMAKELDVSYKAAWAVENAPNPRAGSIDNYVEAIANLKNLGNLGSIALTYPQSEVISIPRREEYKAERDDQVSREANQHEPYVPSYETDNDLYEDDYDDED